MKKIILLLLLCVSANIASAFSFSSNSQTGSIETQLHHAKTKTDIQHILATQLMQGMDKQNTLQYLKQLGFEIYSDKQLSNSHLQRYFAIKKIKSNFVCINEAVITINFSENTLSNFSANIQTACL